MLCKKIRESGITEFFCKWEKHCWACGDLFVICWGKQSSVIPLPIMGCIELTRGQSKMTPEQFCPFFFKN